MDVPRDISQLSAGARELAEKYKVLFFLQNPAKLIIKTSGGTQGAAARTGFGR